MKKDNKSWILIALGALGLSLLSLLLPIIIADGKGYNLFGLLNGSFLKEVMSYYRGSFMQNVNYSQSLILIVILAVIGISAIVVAYIGIRSMSKQYESARPFQMAIAGLVGTAIPSLAMLLLYVLAKNGFPFSVKLGTYVFITPIAMVLACMAVTRRHKITEEERKLRELAARFIHPAGDLPPLRKDSQYYGR